MMQYTLLSLSEIDCNAARTQKLNYFHLLILSICWSFLETHTSTYTLYLVRRLDAFHAQTIPNVYHRPHRFINLHNTRIKGWKKPSLYASAYQSTSLKILKQERVLGGEVFQLHSKC